jgi:hypothetical protein
LNHLASAPTMNHTTCELKQLQRIMLDTDGVTMASGKLWDIVSKRICPGVYRISLELKND